MPLLGYTGLFEESVLDRNFCDQTDITWSKNDKFLLSS